MKDLIKTIRTKLNLNQEQLASLMGVSPVTVNRWENGKANPSLMAQNQLYQICVGHQLDLAEYIVQREQADEIFLPTAFRAFINPSSVIIAVSCRSS